MGERPKREIRPPAFPPAEQMLNYANPKVEREIARRWRRNRIEHLKSVIGAYGAGVLVIVLITLYVVGRVGLWVRIWSLMR